MLTLQKYNIKLKYIAGKDNILEDALSRLSLKETTEDTAEEKLELQAHMVHKNSQATSAKTKGIQEETAKDSCLMGIARYVIERWPTRRDQIPADVKPYILVIQRRVINDKWHIVQI